MLWPALQSFSLQVGALDATSMLPLDFEQSANQIPQSTCFEAGRQILIFKLFCARSLQEGAFAAPPRRQFIIVLLQQMPKSVFQSRVEIIPFGLRVGSCGYGQISKSRMDQLFPSESKRLDVAAVLSVSQFHKLRFIFHAFHDLRTIQGHLFLSVFQCHLLTAAALQDERNETEPHRRGSSALRGAPRKLPQ